MEAFFNVKINKKKCRLLYTGIRSHKRNNRIVVLYTNITFFYLRREVLIESVIGEEIMAQSKVTQKDKKKEGYFFGQPK